MTIHRAVRLAGGAVLVVVSGLLGADPAAADPPQPTDYRSVIDTVEPRPEGYEIDVVGGDAFLELRVDEGHEAQVDGYEGEPYLRFRTDGTVERNRHSPATYVNDDRLGDVAVPADADAEADPDWEEVAAGGTYAWHDHRIHYMAPGRPPGLSAGDVIQDWTVELTVDGTPTTVEGRLLWVEPVSPLPWVALGVLVAAGIVLAGRRAPAVGAAAALAAAALAIVVGWGQYADAPGGSGVSTVLVAVPAAGLVAGAAGLALRGAVARAARAATAATLGAVAAVIGWGLLRLDVLWKPVLPTVLPDGLDRAGTAMALAMAAAAAAIVVWTGGLTPAPATASAHPGRAGAVTVVGEDDGDDANADHRPGGGG